MKHKLKTLWLLLAMIAAVVGVALLALRVSGDSQGQMQTSKTYPVTQYAEQEIAQILVRNLSGETYAIALDGSFSSAKISGFHQGVPLNLMTLSGVVKKIAQCVSYSAPIPVTQDTLSEYGLDQPKAAFTLCFVDGTRKTLLLGNETVTKNGHYLWEQGDADAYVVEHAFYIFAGYAANSYIDTTLAQINQDDRFKITNLSLYNKETGQTLAIKRKAGGEPVSALSMNTFLVTAPAVFDASDENLKTYLFNHLASFSAKEVYSLDYTPEHLQRLGFDNPDYVLSFSADGEDYALRFSRLEDGTLVALLNDIPVIYTVDSSSTAFLDATLDQIVSPFLTMQGITEIERFEVDDGQTNYVFALRNDSSDLNVLCQGNPIDIDSFRRLYSMAAQIYICGLAENPSQEELVLRLSYERKDGTTAVVEFFNMDGRFCFATLDGEGLFQVRLSDIENFLDALATCIQGGSLTR